MWVLPASLSLSYLLSLISWVYSHLFLCRSHESEHLRGVTLQDVRAPEKFSSSTLSEKSHHVSEQDWTWTIQTKHHCRTSDPRQQLFQSVKIKRVQPPSVPRFHTWEYNVSWRENKSSGFSWPYLNTTSDEQ